MLKSEFGVVVIPIEIASFQNRAQKIADESPLRAVERFDQFGESRIVPAGIMTGTAIQRQAPLNQYRDTGKSTSFLRNTS